MDKDLYEIMREIFEEKKTEFTKDIKYLGTITSDEASLTGMTEVTRDVFIMIDVMPDGSIVQKFYDENKHFIAGRDKDGRVYPSSEFANDDLSFLGQFENLNKSQGISLNELDEKLERVTKHLGIPKNDILAISETSLEQKVGKKEEGQITLDEKNVETPEIQTKKNEEALNNINSKQEINMDKKVDDRHTLAEIMGVETGSKLIAVYSAAIADNKNTTRFSLIIQNADGSLQSADNLEQTGGKDSDKEVYEVNRDGSRVEKMDVKSSYKIDSPLVENALLNVRYGSMGYIEIDYGYNSKVAAKEALTEKLETDHDYYTTPEVRKEFSPKNAENGVRNIEDDLAEIKEHEEQGCSDLTLAEADGDPTTGHKHEDGNDTHITDNNHDDVIQEVLGYGDNNIYTEAEVEDRLNKMSMDHPEESFEEVVERTKRDLDEDTRAFPTRDTRA